MTWRYSIRSMPIDVAPMFRVTGQLTRDGFLLTAADDETTRRFADRDWAGCDVRVRWSYRASEREVLNPQMVRDLFGTALRLKVEGIAEPDRQLRAPEVAAAKTLPDKLAAYRHEATLAPSVASKLAALEHGDVPALLSEVALTVKELEQGEKATVAA